MTSTHDYDALRPIRRDEIEKMIEICAQSLPTSIRGYNFLRMNLKLRKYFDANPADYEKLVVSDFMRREIYTTRNGKLENCTFISISRTKDYNVYVFSNDTNELRECLMETNLIDYSLGPYFTSFEGRHHKILAEVIDFKKAEIDYEVTNTGRVLSKENALKLEYEDQIPDDVVVETLRVDDANVIDKVWPHRYPGSDDYLKTLIGINDSFGVFSKDTREIRAWVMLNEQFGLGMVHTLPVHRGKGYAKIMIKAMSKVIAEKYDMDVVAFIVQGNTVSEHTFSKIGFVQIPYETYTWVFIKKQ